MRGRCWLLAQISRYYTYNDHDDVEAVTGTGGTTTATYGYTAYGQPDPGQYTGTDKNNTQPSASSAPFNSYRYNAMRWDSTSGQYDMGFRNYAPNLNQFLSRDMYDGALDDMQLTTDPFTGNRYTFGAGNPVSNIELDGHVPTASPGGGPCPESGCPGYIRPVQAAYPHPKPNAPPFPVTCLTDTCGDPVAAAVLGLTGIPGVESCANGSAMDCVLTAGMFVPVRYLRASARLTRPAGPCGASTSSRADTHSKGSLPSG
jgi:RHS repeat-associated protein